MPEQYANELYYRFHGAGVGEIVGAAVVDLGTSAMERATS